MSLLSVWSWEVDSCFFEESQARHTLFLGLSLFIRKMGLIAESASEGRWRIQEAVNMKDLAQGLEQREGSVRNSSLRNPYYCRCC